MGRSNWILVGLGLVASLALTLMMQQALHVRNDRVVDPVAVEVTKTFGGRLSGPTRWRARKAPKAMKAGTLTLQPTVGVNEENLARDAGDFVWRRVGHEFSSLLVVCDSGIGDASCFNVPPPWEPTVPLMRVELPRLDSPASPR